MITILYSCDKCGIADRAVEVPARPTADTDVCQWMRDSVAAVLSADHDTMSPWCSAKSLTMVKIGCPPGTEFIGQQVE